MNVQKRRAEEVRGYVNKWLERMRLQNWDVTVTISAANKTLSPKLLAEIEYRPRYHEADMTVYPYLWESEQGASARYREATIVHELCHIYLGQMDVLYDRLRDGNVVNVDQWKDALEQATEAIAKALVR